MPEYPHQAIVRGLAAIGYEPVFLHQAGGLDLGGADLLVTWSPWEGSMRKRITDIIASRGKPVIVMENAWLPIGAVPMFQVARDGWNGTGRFTSGGPERWRSWGIHDPEPWRFDLYGCPAVIIAQRGHPTDRRTAPPGWEMTVNLPSPWEIRKRDETEPLIDQLRRAREVHIWTSSVGALALHLGVPVVLHGPNHMLAELMSKPEEPMLPDNRLEVFQRCAWAQWTASEIATGLPFARCLS